MQIGKNTISSEKLNSFVERVEHIDAEKKSLTQDRAVIMAEAKADGFTPSAINFVVKVRKQKPHDRQEKEAMREMYLHAMGLDVVPPLFRYAGLAAVDVSVREQVIERMREFVPNDGHIDVKFGAETIRLKRLKDGNVTDEVVVPQMVKKQQNFSAENLKSQHLEIPDVDEDGARNLGRQYAKDNRAVIENPFPFGDKRRAIFDEGWRAENGGDGMGPNEGDD